MLLLEEIDLSDCKVIPEFIEIDTNKSLSSQLELLIEDILQIILFSGKDKFTIDVGWYPEDWNLDGHFRTMLVKNDEWGEPIKEYTSTSLSSLRQDILSSLNHIRQLNDIED
jgi:hypothetical protein